MKSALCFIGLFIVAWCQVHSQDRHTVDSLQGVLQSSLHDTFKVQALIGLAGETYADSPMVAIRYCDQARVLSEHAKYDHGSTEAYGWLAYLYEQQGMVQKALAYYHKSLVGAQKSGHKKDVGTILNNIAAIYKDQGKIQDALAMDKASLMIKYEIGDLEGVSTTLNNMGLIYGSQGKIQEALALYWQSVKIEEKLKNYEGVAISLLNIAYIYKDQKEYEEALPIARKVLDLEQRTGAKYQSGGTLNFLGMLMDEQGKGDSALHYYNKALQVRAEIGDTLGMAYTLKNLGNYHEKVGDLGRAKEAFLSSLASFREGDNKLGETQATTLLGRLFLKTNDIAAAEFYLLHSMQLAEELGFPVEQRNAAEQLQELYRLKGDWKQALAMNETFVQMRDSVANLENKKAAIKSQFRYEYEQKEARLRDEQQHRDALAEAEIAKQKLIRNSFFVGFAVVLLFAAIFLLQRNRIAKEKKRSEELLLNILPAEVAEELKAKGSADAQLIDHVTVLFTDFRGFTQLAEEMGPKELVAELHRCFSAFDEIIQRHGVEKIKTIGDAYMAAGGLPTPNTTHAKDVVRAAMEIQQFMLRQSQIHQAEGKPRWEIRIGIHTGPVIAGIVGLKKFQYDIWGDTVNTASRMESSGEVGKVNLSGTTYELVKDTFKCTYRGKIAAKGKGDIDMYFLEA